MRRLCVATAVLFLSLAFTGPVVADAIGTGCECFTTASPGTQVQIPNFAATFPGCTTGSSPDGIVSLVGCPGGVPCHGCLNAVVITSTDAHGTPVDPNSTHGVNTSESCPPTVDTVVCRNNVATFTSVGESHPITTELVELSLCSTGCPIVCPGGVSYSVRVGKNGSQPTGTTNFTATGFAPSLSGTTTLGTVPGLPAGHFPVNFNLTFPRCDAPGSIGPVPGSIDFTVHHGGFTKSTILSMSSVWQQALLAGLLIVLTAWFLVARRRRTSGEKVS